MKTRQRDILTALRNLGGTATTREIAERCSLNVNGVSQSLGALADHVVCLGGKSGETRWMSIKLQERLRLAEPIAYLTLIRLVQVHETDPPLPEYEGFHLLRSLGTAYLHLACGLRYSNSSDAVAQIKNTTLERMRAGNVRICPDCLENLAKVCELGTPRRRGPRLRITVVGRDTIPEGEQ
jgi:hypothetical protein